MPSTVSSVWLLVCSSLLGGFHESPLTSKFLTDVPTTRYPPNFSAATATATATATVAVAEVMLALAFAFVFALQILPGVAFFLSMFSFLFVGFNEMSDSVR